MNETYNILIIDDDDIDRLSYKRVLKGKEADGYNFNILEASLGHQGVTLAIEQEPDAILADFHLPDCTAKEIIEKIKSNQNISSVPIIVMTGHGSEKTAMTALRLGAKDYLIKDQLKPKLLIKTILKHIENHRAEKLEQIKAQKIQHQAHHDFLTGLANRIHLEHEIQRIVAACERHDRKVGVMFLDLDKFKPINDTYGHAVGDQLLIQVSNRLKDLVRAEDVVARIGGDEFVVVLPEIQQKSDIEEKAQVMISVLSAPYPVDDKFLEVDVSIGISVFPDDKAEDCKTLMHQADLAMYEAKSTPGNHYHLFGEQKLISNQEMLSNIFAYAFHNDELNLQFNPCMNLGDSTVDGFEPIIDWVHPQYQNISTKKIFHYAQELGMHEALWSWFFEQSLPNIKPGVSCIIDCDKEMLESLATSSMLTDYLQQYQMQASQIIIKLEELMIAHGDIDVIKSMRSLHQQGHKIYLKNIGVSGLPLSVLTTLPIEGITISPLFVHEMMIKEKMKFLVQSIISICENFGFRVMAEGVVTPQQEALLMDFGCLFGQGPKYDNLPPSASQQDKAQNQ